MKLRNYLTLGTIADVAMIVGAGSALYGATQSGRGSASGVPGSMSYVPQGQGNADALWQQIMQQWGTMSNEDAGVLVPFLRNALGQSMAGVPVMQNRMNDVANLDIGAGRGMLDSAERLRTAAFDPNKAMYDRRLQQTQEGSRAASSMRGIGMGAQAAGLENDATRNFNTDWDYNALQRMIAGSDAAGRSATGGVGALQSGVGMNLQGMNLPFSLAGSYGGAMGSSVYNPYNALGSNLGSYMGLGQSGSAAAFNQGQVNMNTLNSALGQLPGAWGAIQRNWGTTPGGGYYGGGGAGDPGGNWDSPG